MLATFRSLLPRRPACYLSRYLTSNAKPAEGTNKPPGIARNLRHAQVLLSEVEALLEKSGSNNVDVGLRHAISNHIDYISTPHIALGKVITLLLDNRRLKEAADVYEDLVDRGYVPSPESNSQMLAVAIALSANSMDDLTAAVDALATSPTYSEERLVPILRTIRDWGVPPKALIRIIQRFLEVQGEGYSPGRNMLQGLVDAQVRAGKLEDALETVLRFDVQEDEAPTEAISSAYIAILAAVKDTRSWDSASAAKVLGLMTERNVTPTTALFNILISREVRQRNLHQAFALYHFLIHTSIAPDDYTYGSLFAILNKLYKPTTRSARLRPFKRPDNVVSPRQLYCDMMKNTSNPGFKLTSSLLNVTLRTFISKQDYAGAIVVLGSFSLSGVRINAKTYYIVMRHLMNRIRGDIIGTRRPQKWTEAFLGIESPEGLTIDDSLAKRILAFGGQRKFSLTMDVYSVPLDKASLRRSGTLITPTLEMVDGETPVPVDMDLDPLPLQRILRRAILASLSSAKLVSSAIASAKSEMLPK